MAMLNNHRVYHPNFGLADENIGAVLIGIMSLMLNGKADPLFIHFPERAWIVGSGVITDSGEGTCKAFVLTRVDDQPE